MSQKQLSVGVLGGGAFGTTLAHLSASGGHPTLLWLRDGKRAREISEQRANHRYLPDHELAAGIDTTDDLAEVAERCQLILIAIPSGAFRAVARELGDVARGDHLLVSGTKGLERSSYLRMTELLRQETCCLKVGAISGPNLALEILAGVPGGTVVASAYDEVVRAVAIALHSPHFRVYASHDVVGVELGGAIKNVLAIAGGIAKGMGFGDNTLSLMVARGMAEMTRLGAAMGADATTFSGLAGIGDLVVTAFSALSRNHRVGLRLAKGQTVEDILAELGQVAEGVPTARVAREWAAERRVDLPICEAVYRVIYDHVPPLEAMENILAAPPRWEATNAPVSLEG